VVRDFPDSIRERSMIMHHITARMILTILALMVAWLIVDIINALLKIKIAKMKERSRNKLN